jgi:hypothetical protein
MEQPEKISFEIEEIGNDQKLFYRIHQLNIDSEIDDPKLKIKPSAFDPQPKPNSVEMSVNWEKYSTAEFTKNQARKPEKNGVLSFITKDVRNIPVNLNVSHKPTANQSHSLIHDVVSEQNDPEIRMNLRTICKWEIQI